MADPLPRHGAFIWYELMVPDPSIVAPFYREVAGWTIPTAGAIQGGVEYRMIGRAGGGFAGGVLTLSPAMTQGGMVPRWVGYIHHPDVDAAAQAITDAGGQCFMQQDVPEIGRMAMLADPQGALLYVMDPTPPAGDPEAQSDVFGMEPGRMCWNQLMTSDPVAATALYTGLFGWTQEGAMPMGALGDYLFIQHQGEAIGAIMPLMPDMARSQWHFYISVDDIDRAAAAVIATGGSHDGEIMQVPGGSWTLNAVDPAGANIGLAGPRKEHG